METQYLILNKHNLNLKIFKDELIQKQKSLWNFAVLNNVMQLKEFLRNH